MASWTNITVLLFLCVFICLDHHHQVSAKHGHMILMPQGGHGPMIIKSGHKKKKHGDLIIIGGGHKKEKKYIPVPVPVPEYIPVYKEVHKPMHYEHDDHGW